MIRPLRRAHFRVWLVLAVVLPALLVAALAARRETTPRNPDLHWKSFSGQAEACPTWPHQGWRSFSLCSERA